MMITSLIAVAFGTFGTGANNTTVAYDNTLILRTGVVNVGTLKNQSNYAGMDYEYRVTANCDFRETTNDNGDLEYWVHFNSWTGAIWYYPDTGTPTIYAQNSTYFNYFESSVINDPLNNFTISVSLGNQTANRGTIYGDCRWYDHGLDEESGISVSKSELILGSNLVAKRPESLEFNYDLDNLYQQVRNAFGLAKGGYTAGYDNGYADGNANGYGTGYDDGYADGFAHGVETDDTAFTIFNGILTIGMIPINVFLAMFDFDILGINISNFVMSLLTVLVTLWVIRTISGGKNENS